MSDYIRVSEAARRLGCHPNTVKAIPPIDLPYYRLGHRGDRRYHVDDVSRYIDERRRSWSLR